MGVGQNANAFRAEVIRWVGRVVSNKVIVLDPSAQSADSSEILTAEVTALEMLNSVKLRLAQQYAPRSWQSWIDKVAEAVEQGVPLEAALGKHESVAPREAAAIASSSLLVGDPAQLILDAVRKRIELRRSWRELWMLMLYPTVALVFAVTIGVFFSSVMDFQFLEEFGLSGAAAVLATVKDQQQAIYGLAFVVGWTVLVFGTIAIIGPAWALTAVMGGVRIFGRPLRWIHLSELLYRYYLFIGQGLSSADASAAVSRSFSASSQRYAAEGIETRIAQGASLGNAFAATSLSDALSRPALRMLDHRDASVVTSLSETTELLQMLVEQRCRSLASVIPMLVLLIVGSVVWSILSCYVQALLPLVSLITSLA